MSDVLISPSFLPPVGICLPLTTAATNMDPVFKKLNLKDNKKVFVLNAPPSFKLALDTLSGIAAIKTSLSGAGDVGFFLAFVTKQKEVDDLTKAVVPRMGRDGLLWFAYPKGTSKKYVCEFNRDSGWALLGEFDFEPVRQIAIDEDWTALRFRRAENIKTMTRGFAMSKTGKKKVAASKKKSSPRRS